jgi:hypothetical protein
VKRPYIPPPGQGVPRAALLRRLVANGVKVQGPEVCPVMFNEIGLRTVRLSNIVSQQTVAGLARAFGLSMGQLYTDQKD